MMKRFLFSTVVILCFNSNAQNQFGAGINIGVRNTGLELQYHFLNRIKVYGGLNLSRFDSYSNKVGIGISLKTSKKKHNFWVATSMEYKYSKTTILEKNDIFYSYSTNDLNYINFGGIYNYRINNSPDRDDALLLEVEMFWKQLFNQLAITENEIQQSAELRSSIEKYFNSGLGFSLGLKYVF